MYGTMEQVREPRFLMNGPLAYTDGSGDAGRAAWLDVSRVGGAMHLGRYVRPGRTIQLHFTAADGTEDAVAARIIWCEALAESGRFAAGFRILRDDPESALHYAQLRLGRPALQADHPHVSGPGGHLWPVAPFITSNLTTTARMAALPHAV